MTSTLARSWTTPTLGTIGSGGGGKRFRSRSTRFATCARRRPQRHAPQLEHGEEVRVGELVLEAHADDVEVGEREVALEGDERETVRAEERLQVGPRRVGALGRHLGAPVQDVVQDLEPE